MTNWPCLLSKKSGGFPGIAKSVIVESTSLVEEGTSSQIFITDSNRVLWSPSNTEVIMDLARSLHKYQRLCTRSFRLMQGKGRGYLLEQYPILFCKQKPLQESHIITLTMDQISHEELMNLAKFLRHLTAGIRPTVLHYHHHHHHSQKPAISGAFSARAQESMVGLAGLYLFLSPLNIRTIGLNSGYLIW